MDYTNQYMNYSQDQLLTEYGASYNPVSFEYSYVMSRARPFFSFDIIDEMVMDPRVAFGLMLIKGPIQSNTRFAVKAEDEEVTKVIINELNRFWNRAISQVLDGIEWGSSSSEVLYELDSEGNLTFKGLNNFKARDCRVVTIKGKRAGVHVNNSQAYGYAARNLYFGGPKHFHYVHWRKFNKHYGRSRLHAVMVPWWEIWAKGGYRDIRRLWFTKHSFTSGLVRYPTGRTNVPNKGVVDNHSLAMEIATKVATGSVAVAPSTRSAGMKEGEYDWMFDPVKANSIPGGLFDYGGILRIEILEAMGIPYEVIEASGNEGFGSSSGRQIPLVVYNSILFELIQDILHDYQTQILDFLLMSRFKEKVDYEIHPYPLQTPEQEQENPNTSPEDDKNQKNDVSGKSISSSRSEKNDSSSSDMEQEERESGVAYSL